MANSCGSVAAYTKQCGQGVAGGIEKLWVIGYNDLAYVSGSTQTYALASGSTVISNIALASGGTKFVSIGTLQQSVSFKGTAKRDVSTGAFSNETEITVTISDISDVAKTFLNSVSSQPVAFIVKLASGKYIANGLNGYTELTQTDEASGVKIGDANGYTLTFSGVQNSFTSTVDSTLIATIVDKV